MKKLLILGFFALLFAMVAQAQTVIKMPMKDDPDFSITVQETGISGINYDNNDIPMSRVYAKSWFWKDGNDMFHYVEVLYRKGTSDAEHIEKRSFKRSDMASIPYLDDINYEIPRGDMAFFLKPTSASVECVNYSAPDYPANAIKQIPKGEKIMMRLSNDKIGKIFKPYADKNPKTKDVKDFMALTKMVRDMLNLPPIEEVGRKAMPEGVLFHMYDGFYTNIYFYFSKDKKYVYKVTPKIDTDGFDMVSTLLDKTNIREVTITEPASLKVLFKNKQAVRRTSTYLDKEYLQDEFVLNFGNLQAAEKFKKELFSESQKDIDNANTVDASGNTYFMNVIQAKDQTKFNILMNNGANVIYVNPLTKVSVLRCAIDAGDDYMVQKIMDAPAMKRPLSRYEDEFVDVSAEFMYAIEKGRESVVRSITVYGGRRYNYPNEKGYYPTMIAYQQGQLKICASLAVTYTQGGYDYTGEYFRQTKDEGMNILMMAVEKNDLNAIKELKLFGVDKKLQEMNKDGYTALMIAAEKGHTDIVKFAIENKYRQAWTFQSTKGKMAGKSALDIAKTKEIKNLIKNATK